MVTYAACYPGQGAQKPQMALDLHAHSQRVRDLFSLASEVCSLDLFSILQNADGATLRQTELTQVAITLANRSASLVLQDLGIDFSCHAGFSLGELSAYAGSGVLDEQSLFSVVSKRGRLMAKASVDAEKTYGTLGMAAVIGLGFDAVQSVLSHMGSDTLFCANDNGPKQVVLSGTARELARCEDALKEAGARRIIPLRVSGPFHTPFMEDAVREFSEFLESVPYSDPQGILYANVTGNRVESGTEVRKLCAMQLSSPVKWITTMEQMVHDGVSKALEIGPGSVLTGLWRSSGLSVDCTPAGTYDEIEKIREAQA